MNKSFLEEKLKEIDQVILSKHSDQKDLGVLTGLAGISLFQFYYSKYRNIDDHAKAGVNIITSCVHKINAGYSYPTFCTGIAGFGWVMDHLEQMDFLDTQNDNLLPQLDNYLYTVMIDNMKNGDYDLLHGGIGYAFYFLKRYENTKSDQLKAGYRVILYEFIRLLKNASEENKDNQLKWPSIDFETEEKVYNLSLSHGISSIIGILTKLYAYNEFRMHTAPLLQGAINYVLEFKNEDIDAFSVFPNWIPKKGKPNEKSKLAWCYGDLGIGLQLLHASKVLKNSELKSTALGILKHAAKRTSPKKSMVTDAGICHGSFGIALVFNRVYKETRDPIFKKAAKFWIQEGLNMAVHEDGYAGYKQWQGQDKKWNSEVSVLEGIAGIGLVILDYLSNDDSSWDESLMIS